MLGCGGYDRTTYICGHQRLLFQQVLHGFIIDCIDLVIYYRACFLDFISAAVIVDASQSLPLFHVGSSAQVMDFLEWHETARAGAPSLVTNTRQKDPENHDAEWVRARSKLIVNTLLWIISRICKYPRIEPSFNSIETTDDNAMFATCYKLVVQEDWPLCMYNLTPTVCHQGLTRPSTHVLRNKVFKDIRELIQSLSVLAQQDLKWRDTYGLKVSNMTAKITSRLAASIFWIISKHKITGP